MKIRHFLSMLSFLAVAFICTPSHAGLNDPDQVASSPDVVLAMQDMQNTPPEDTSLSPREQVDNARNTVVLEKDYVLNLKATDPTMYCLAQNAFFEARAENFANKVAVTEVVKNRLDSGRYAGTLCAVVKQKNEGICQFSWVCQHLGNIPLRDGTGDVRPEIYRQWYDCVLAAYVVVNKIVEPLVPGATNFYAQRTVRPSWSARFKRIAVIGGHTFMKPRE